MPPSVSGSRRHFLAKEVSVGSSDFWAQQGAGKLGLGSIIMKPGFGDILWHEGTYL